MKNLSENSEHIDRFWNGEASKWSLSDKNHLVGWYNEHMNDENEEKILFRNVKLDGSLVALEYGCGPGRNMIKFNKRFKRIDGVDISKVILEKLPVNLREAGITEIPNLYNNNGYDLINIESKTYDVVFSIICMQHINSREWRLNLYREINRVLKPGGTFTFQMGYGPGHPISVDYFHNYTSATEKTGLHKDVRVEDERLLFVDLETNGFGKIDYMITDPCHDLHPKWIWVSCVKE